MLSSCGLCYSGQSENHSRIRSIIAKGPKYRFPVHIDIQKCREKLKHLLMISVIVGVSEGMSIVMF